MIDVIVRVDHITDRQRRVTFDRGTQRTSGARRSAGIDHRNAPLADDEADIRDVVVTGRIKRHQASAVHEHAVCDFVDPKFRTSESRKKNQREYRDQPSHGGDYWLPGPDHVALKCASFESAASKCSGPFNGCSLAMRNVGFSLSEMPVSASSTVLPPAVRRMCEM